MYRCQPARLRIHDQTPAGAVVPEESDAVVSFHADKGAVYVWRILKQPETGGI
jgi:hypothetical protein